MRQWTGYIRSMHRMSSEHASKTMTDDDLLYSCIH